MSGQGNQIKMYIISSVKEPKFEPSFRPSSDTKTKAIFFEIVTCVTNRSTAATQFFLSDYKTQHSSDSTCLPGNW